MKMKRKGSCMMRKWMTCSCLTVLAAMAFSWSAWAQTAPLNMTAELHKFIEGQEGNFKLNLRAYKDITFGALFGALPSNAPAAVSKAADPCAVTTPPIGETGISLAGLFAYIQYNLEPNAAEYDAVLKIITGKVLPALQNSGAPEGPCLGSWRVRSFFETNMETKYAENETVAGFYKAVRELEGAGLTMPWLLVEQTNQCDAFRQLLALSPFLERMGRLTYPHFFFLGLDDPFVDEQAIEFTQYAINIGLFGAFHIYRGNPTAAVDPIKLTSAVKAAYSCCNKTTKICETSVSSTSYCTMCGDICCLGSRWCP